MECEDRCADGPYYPLVGSEVNGDLSRLKQLGYRQELSRGLSFVANFSVTFSIVSVITGITTLYNQGLTFGGPMTMVCGWPVVGLMTLVVGLSMAEICSAYPTAGGLYFWSAKLCDNSWAPFASWLTGWASRGDRRRMPRSSNYGYHPLLTNIFLEGTTPVLICS